MSPVDKKVAALLGACSSIAFLLAIYFDEAGQFDLSGDDFLSIAVKVLILLPFLVYVGGRGLTDFLTMISCPEDRDKMMRYSAIRFWCFAGGMFGVFLPGAMILFAVIS